LDESLMLREPSIAESAKQRSLRIPLDYYARGDAIVRTKLILSTLVAVGTGVYFVWLMLGGSAARQHASPGPVAPKHAAWNNQCDVCHQNSTPLRADAVSLTGLVSGNAASRELLDRACLKCHNEPPHHSSAKPGDVPSCSACHREHQSGAADIVRPADTMCLNCHRDIDRHRDGKRGSGEVIGSVTGFEPPPSAGPAPHPEFRSLRSDPGNVKFNHWLHLQRGIASADSKHKLTLADLGDEHKPQYAAYAKTDNLVQLDCTACHQPAASDGRQMRPIDFEQHCRACHPLQLPLDGQQPADVPHGLSAARLAVVIDGFLFAAQKDQQAVSPQSADESSDGPLIPGKTLGQNLAQKIKQDVFGKRAAATRLIAAKCNQCHHPRPSSAVASGDLPDFLPANIPNPWLEHARFNHSAHRHADCRACHAAAYAFEQHDQPRHVLPAAGKQRSDDDEQVMIAGLDTCATCHAPKRGDQGGARFDCAECHAYHRRNPEHSFPASSLRTHYHAVPASPAPQHRPRMRQASFQRTANPEWLGASSCASAGCHGDVRGDAPHWRSALAMWAANDPHAQAFDVLWTVRAREMTRLLHSRPPDAPAPPQLSDADHIANLNERCIGCHATPNQESGNDAFGVHCESCHGAAGGWLHAHSRSDFRRDSSPGFIDTKDLSQRAAACMPCHVGPSNTAGNLQIVDHDLIAAGHPRLAFEFHSYFQSLPAHWDREADEGRQPGAFHFRSWLAGQSQQAKQRGLARDQPVDFAQLDCFACHHQLAADSSRRPSPHGALAPIDWPPMSLRDDQAASLNERFALVRRLLIEARDQDVRWDSCVQALLATEATLADVTKRSQGAAASDFESLTAALAYLRLYLGIECFPATGRGTRPPTQYDSPSQFDAHEMKRRVSPAIDSLRRLEATATD
jgi:predicted CXXCH cytochrome family protein